MKFIFVFLLIAALSFLQGCAGFQENVSSFLFDIEMKRSGILVQTIMMKDHETVYLERKGEGESVVLLHGFSSDKTDWIRFVRYLPKNYHIIALDLPGHGDNIDAGRFEKYDPLSLSHEIADMIEVLGLERFHLAGNSLGGLVSKLYAREHPDKVMTLGLFNSAGVTPSVPGDFYEALKKGKNPFSVETKADWENLKTYAFYKQPFLPWPVNDVMARKRIRNNAFYLDIFKSVSEHKTITDPEFQVDMLQKLSMPVMVVWGDKDRILNVTSVEVYLQHVKKVQTLILKDCGHVPMIEMPKLSAEHYARFISQFRFGKKTLTGNL